MVDCCINRRGKKNQAAESMNSDFLKKLELSVFGLSWEKILL
jgi:hypothetical protein